MDQYSFQLQTLFYSLYCYDIFLQDDKYSCVCKGKENRDTRWGLKHLQVDDWMEDGLMTSIYLGLKKVVSIISSQGVENKLHIFEAEFHSLCVFI